MLLPLSSPCVNKPTSETKPLGTFLQKQGETWLVTNERINPFRRRKGSSNLRSPEGLGKGGVNALVRHHISAAMVEFPNGLQLRNNA